VARSGTLSVKSPVNDIQLGGLSVSGVIFPVDERTPAVGAGLIKFLFQEKLALTGQERLSRV
jgi:hypothetical protein